MAAQLKNSIDSEFIEKLGKELLKHDINFNRTKFLADFKRLNWSKLELKARIHAITVAMNEHLSGDYNSKTVVILNSLSVCKGLAGWVFPYFIELHGTKDIFINWDVSVNALKKITPYFSSEFAIRHFIVSDQDKMINTLLDWSKDTNFHVRRLASEGCRPKLPWAIRLHNLVKNPTPIIPILENLKNDPELYVRKSVANNLNDISKDHPDLVIKIAKKWLGHNANTDWILKHGLRTLLKKGNKEAMALFSFEKPKNIKISKIKFSAQKFIIGKNLEFNFNLENAHNKNQRLRIDYILYYLRKSGGYSKKVFKLKENEFIKGVSYKIKKQHSLKQMTTRKHYKGKHKLEIAVNGEVMSRGEFLLT